MVCNILPRHLFVGLDPQGPRASWPEDGTANFGGAVLKLGEAEKTAEPQASLPQVMHR